MEKLELPIPIHQLAFLQAYIYQVFTLEIDCKKDFRNSEWFLKENHTDEEVNSIIEFFRSQGFKCDCDIINKFDLRELSKGVLVSHE